MLIFARKILSLVRLAPNGFSPGPRRARWAIVVCMVLLSTLLVGCSLSSGQAKKNTLTPVTMTAEDISILSNDPSDVFRQHYRVTKGLAQLRLYVEIWRDGKVLERQYFRPLQSKDSVIALAEKDDIIDITHQVKGANPGDPWKQVSFQAALGDSPLTELTLDLPTDPPLSAVGTSWYGSSSSEGVLPIVEAAPIIIMYLPFNAQGEEKIAVYDCSYLMDHPEALEQYAYALVVRAEFTKPLGKKTDKAETPEDLSKVPTPFLNLDEAVTNAIMTRGFHSLTIDEETYVTSAHKVLKVEEGSGHTTAYVIATKLCFTFRGGLTPTGGGYKPAVITFAVDSAGRYTVSDYWQPTDGDTYESDIRSKFPQDVVEEALNVDKYLIALSQQCYKNAMVESAYDPIDEIKRMISLISENPADSHDLEDHIFLRRYDYNQLLILDDYTLKFVFQEFLDTPQTGVRAQLLAKLMSDLLGGESIGENYLDGQAYFNAWKNHVLTLRDQHTADFFQTGAPKAFILLQLLEKL